MLFQTLQVDLDCAALAQVAYQNLGITAIDDQLGQRVQDMRRDGFAIYE